jgi:hypothetical protein
MTTRLGKILLAVARGFLGVLLGILLLEAAFRSNPTLLPRGIAAPLPVDAPLTDREYVIRYSDADIFYWQASQVRPPAEDRVEARVHWRTDEFGFPNPAPIPETVDVVILGRSYSMGAQAENPWPEVLRNAYGLRVLNLSQTGSGIREKRDFFQRFGLPRSPRFAVIEILPAFDILEYGRAETWVVQRAVFPFAQSALRKLYPPSTEPDAGGYIYPLPLNLGGESRECVFYSGYLAALSLSEEDWSRSDRWSGFRSDLVDLVAFLRAEGIVPIILFVPTKETVYLPESVDPAALEAALAAAGSWIRVGGELRRSSIGPDPLAATAEASAAEELIREFSADQSICLVDPTPAFEEAIREKGEPFMVYDTHWSGEGHAIVAREVAAALGDGTCR